MKFNFDNTYIKLPEELFSTVAPTPVKQPILVFYNNELGEDLGIDRENNSETEIAELLSGNKLPAEAASLAQAYSGHQFGNFTTLGDGRAILLGEQITPQGKRYDVQLKGAGITPYSRSGDGRATLSSMLREYIFSEALHALHIPTSRSLAVVATGETVFREEAQQGGVLTRVASSHIRVGTFQHARQFTSEETQKALTSYTIERHYPHLKESQNPALDLVDEVINQQISLIVNWMRVGFIHGVMNTDNMLLSGESIDFGPCAFMNGFKSNTVFSSIDHRGRYAFDQQPSIALWNITRLAESLLPQIDTDSNRAIEKVKTLLSNFEGRFRKEYLAMLFHKIGISNPNSEDQQLLNRLMTWMESYKSDYTNTFVQLTYPEIKLCACFEEEEVQQWVNDWKARLRSVSTPWETQLKLMQANNPIYIPRNNTVEDVLNAITKEDNPEAINAFMSKIQHPYTTCDFDLTYMQSPEDNFDTEYKTYCGT